MIDDNKQSGSNQIETIKTHAKDIRSWWKLIYIFL